MQKNPLLSLSTVSHHAVDFSAIKPEHFLPALDEAIRVAKSRIEKIKQQPASFLNSIDALECAGERVDWIQAIFFNLLGAETSDTLQALAQELGPKIASYANDILLDATLFAKVRTVFEQLPSLALTGEQKRLLENTYSEFVRNGANLNEEQKIRLREIDQRLSQLGPKFNENNLKASNSFELWLKTPEELSGLPESALEAARAAAEAKGRPTEYLFSLQAPSYVPFLKFSANRPAREKLWRAFNTRSLGGEFDNQPLILEMVKLRYERARLLGYETHAHFTLERRMAESTKNVGHFLDRLLEKFKPTAQKEVRDVEAFAKKSTGLDCLMPWDFSFYSEKLKEERFQFNEEDLRPYFKLENVTRGVFEIAKRLYDLEFTEKLEYPTYHPDVKVYEVNQTRRGKTEFIGLFYADFFPRATKRDGAWMTNFLEQGRFEGEVRRPHVSIVCNFTKPTAQKPSLLTYMEVETLFHEFGHALHSLLSRCHYRTLSGTNVYWDFVELPSQVMENWTQEKEALDIFARHFETNQLMPPALIEKLRASQRYLAAYFGIRQLNFAFLDLAWYGQDPSQIQNVAEFEKRITERTSVLPQIEGTNSSCAFGHIFGGGYSAGYYSYKWAEVLDADAFEAFLQNGIFSREVAERFEENILSKGGSEHPAVLYRKFRGRDPDPDALLRRDGLL